jgi:glucose/arabinose dehydrogenase
MRSARLTFLSAIAIAILGLYLLSGNTAAARADKAKQITPSATSIQIVSVLTGMNNPLLVTNAHDGSNRLFIVEQPGTIQVLQPGATTPTLFLDVSSKVQFGGEQGLLGLAFHPQFWRNHRFFVYYTRKSDGNNVVAEYHTNDSNPDVADPNEILIASYQQPFTNHNGGMVEFGADGFLYISKGDGGSGNDPGNRAQNVNDYHGKILRIDIDHASATAPWSPPPSNPFVGMANHLPEIYALGLRNPWRFSFDRQTNQLYVGDVGQDAWEEADIVTLGGNYGWRIFEGNHCTNIDPCVSTGLIFPILEYGHTMSRCAIIGGYVYRGTLGTLPAGLYIYGDLCTGEIFGFDGTASTVLLTTGRNIHSFGEDESGELYMADGGGGISKIASSSPCAPMVSPSSQPFMVGGGMGSVQITAPMGCSWSATTRSPFISFTSMTSGSGNGTVMYSVSQNMTSSPRLGTVAVGGNLVKITQAPVTRTTVPGLYNSQGSSFFLKNSNTTGIADMAFAYGPPASGWIPLVGDWTGSGVKTPGLYAPSTGTFFLRNSNTMGFADITFQFGPGGAGMIPLVGDWDGDGVDTVGLYSPQTSTFFLRNSNTMGVADITFSYGPGGMGLVPIAGDWDGDGITTVGLYDPSASNFFLRNSNSTGVADIAFAYGVGGMGWLPVTGDWNSDSITTIGLYVPSTGTFFLRNSNTTGVSDVAFNYGPGGMSWRPLTGHWN